MKKSEASSHAPSTPTELRSFGLTMALILALLSLFSIWKHSYITHTGMVLCVIASAFGLCALCAPEKLRLLAKYWIALGEFLGKIMTPIVLTLTYFLMVTPLSFLIRALGKDILQLKLDPKKETYWDDTDAEGSAKRYYTPY